MTQYMVVTPEYGAYIPMLDDGTGPMEYGSDVWEGEAKNAREAIDGILEDESLSNDDIRYNLQDAIEERPWRRPHPIDTLLDAIRAVGAKGILEPEGDCWCEFPFEGWHEEECKAIQDAIEKLENVGGDK